MLQRIGRYEILDRIAAGGQGTVYRARDTVLDRVVAVKVINQSIEDDPQYLEALQREARLAAGLDHTNITRVHDFQVEDGTAYIVMEYVPDALDRHLGGGRTIPWQRAVEIASQVARGLQHAHNNGVVHRDIKPQNILLTDDGTVKVSDFGIARALASSTRSRTGSVMGTPAYMSPEQWASGSLDGRIDQYALGIVLYEMLTGSTPFQGESMEALFVHHRESPMPALPRDLQVPAGVERVIRRATEKSQEARYGSTEEMADALEVALGRTPSGGGRSTAPPTPPVVPPGPPVASGSGSGRIGGIPSWLLFGGLGAIAMAVIAIVVALAVGGNGGGTPERVQVAIPADTPAPTDMPVPADTPMPTFSPMPTYTPYPTYTPIPTVTPPSKPTDTPSRAAAPTPTLVAPQTAMPTLTPYPTVTPTPVPTTTSYVLVTEVVDFSHIGEVTFKINNTVTSQTIQASSFGDSAAITELHLSIEEEHQGVNDFEQITGGINGNEGMGPPVIFIGTVSINGQLAPEGTVVTAWQDALQGGGKELVGATIVINEPDEYTGDLGTTLGPLGKNLINVVGFDNKEKQWSFYDPRQSFVHFSSIRTLNNDTAYYITVAEDQDVTLNGISSKLYQGLNIIPWGSYSGVNRLTISPGDGLFSYLGENLVRVWRFGNLTKIWNFFDPRPHFADANSLQILNNNDVIWVGVSEDVDTTINGTSLELFGVSDRSKSESAFNLIIWRHGPLDIVANATPPTPTPRPTATPSPSRATSFGDGSWVVGSDIQPGTYRSSITGSGCYWQRLSGFSGESADIIANEYTDAISVVEIASTDAGFSTERCGTWTEATSAITSSTSSPFGEGVFVVGLDIGSGTWTSPGGDSCYWARLSGFSGNSDHIEANGFGGSNNILTIKSTDKGFESSNCGTWTKTG